MTAEMTAYEAPGGVEIFDPAASSNTALAQLKQHADAMDIAYDLASRMCKTSLVPRIYQGEPANGTAAILYGMELGLNPIQSLQQIFVVHGTPAIYARTMVALVMSHGHRVWTVESSDESVTVSGQRRGNEVVTSVWTIDRARKAGYLTNKKYETDPQGMLYAKAAATVCRQIAPDILLGISYTAEDLQSEPDLGERSSSVTVQQKSSDRPAWETRLGITAAAEATPDPAPDPAPDPEPAPAREADPEPEAPAAADPEPQPDPEPATAAQPTEDNPVVEFVTPARLKTLRAALTRCGITDATERARFIKARIGGREIGAATELTVDEAEQIIEFIAQSEPAGADYTNAEGTPE